MKKADKERTFHEMVKRIEMLQARWDRQNRFVQNLQTLGFIVNRSSIDGFWFLRHNNISSLELGLRVDEEREMIVSIVQNMCVGRGDIPYEKFLTTAKQYIRFHLDQNLKALDNTII